MGMASAADFREMCFLLLHDDILTGLRIAATCSAGPVHDYRGYRMIEAVSKCWLRQKCVRTWAPKEHELAHA